jgi:hypothetical protein
LPPKMWWSKLRMRSLRELERQIKRSRRRSTPRKTKYKLAKRSSDRRNRSLMREVRRLTTNKLQ